MDLHLLSSVIVYTAAVLTHPTGMYHLELKLTSKSKVY